MTDIVDRLKRWGEGRVTAPISETQRFALDVLREDAKDAIAEIERLRTVDWQPMETAPKDGTRITLWHRDIRLHDEGYPVIGAFREYISTKPDWRTDSGAMIRPTRWQPVPNAPKRLS